jgi:hypothetical protein
MDLICFIGNVDKILAGIVIHAPQDQRCIPLAEQAADDVGSLVSLCYRFSLIFIR